MRARALVVFLALALASVLAVASPSYAPPAVSAPHPTLSPVGRGGSAGGS